MPSPAELMEQKMHVSDTMVPNIIAANAICFTIACIAVILRFLARRMARVRYEADDWLIVVALVRGIPIFQSDLSLRVEAYSLTVLTHTVFYAWSRRVRFVRYMAFPYAFTIKLKVNSGIRYGSGRHAILLKNPAALGKV